MFKPLDAVKTEVKRGVQYTVAALVGAGIILAGSAFLLLAIYMALATEVGPVTAATLLGFVLVILGGGILFWVRTDASHKETAAHSDITVGTLLDAFLEGQQAGSAAADRKADKD